MKANSVFLALALSILCVVGGCQAAKEKKVLTQALSEAQSPAAPPGPLLANTPDAWRLLGLRRLWGVQDFEANVQIVNAWMIADYLFLENSKHFFYVFNRHTGEYVFGLDVGTSVTHDPTYFAPDNILYLVAGASCYEIELSNRRVPRTLHLAFAAATGPAVDLLKLYFGSDNNRLAVMDRKGGFYMDGRTVGNAIHSTPVLGDNTVFFGSNDGKVYGVSRSDLEVVRSFQTGAPVTADVVVENNMVYACSQDYFVYCIPTVQPVTGKGDFLWKVSLESAIARSPVNIANRLYVKTVSNGLFALNKEEEGKTVWHIPSGQQFLCVGKKSAYVLMDCRPCVITLVDNETGALKERIDVTGYEFFATNPLDATLYLVSARGGVLALREWEETTEQNP
ncbi:MAG: PQQ-binding-like beta-propeller repeat protein [Planctomycetota bacterium]